MHYSESQAGKILSNLRCKYALLCSSMVFIAHQKDRLKKKKKGNVNLNSKENKIAIQLIHFKMMKKIKHFQKVIFKAFSKGKSNLLYVGGHCLHIY